MILTFYVIGRKNDEAIRIQAPTQSGLLRASTVQVLPLRAFAPPRLFPPSQMLKICKIVADGNKIVADGNNCRRR